MAIYQLRKMIYHFKLTYHDQTKNHLFLRLLTL